MQTILRYCFLLMACSLFTLKSYGQDEYFKLEEKETKTTTRPTTRQQNEKVYEEDRKSLNDFEDKKFIEKLRLGGSFGLSLGTYTNINISPMAGVNLTDKFMVGAGLTYMYINSRSFVTQRSSSYYGGRVLAMYEIFPVVNLQAEFEALNVKYYNYQTGRYSRKWLSSPLIGGAYTQKIDGRFVKGIHLTALYNLNYHSQVNPSVNSISVAENISPYGSPFVFRVTIL